MRAEFRIYVDIGDAFDVLNWLQTGNTVLQGGKTVEEGEEEIGGVIDV